MVKSYPAKTVIAELTSLVSIHSFFKVSTILGVMPFIFKSFSGVLINNSSKSSPNELQLPELQVFTISSARFLPIPLKLSDFERNRISPSLSTGISISYPVASNCQPYFSWRLKLPFNLHLSSNDTGNLILNLIFCPVTVSNTPAQKSSLA